ncbi:beta-phosphoglucomutase family hydrolase [Kineococcus rhizosphaerae]|uniref:Beta-phosphoglucomutase n=1 Tax=Kineococcus rhizosphaerae TaxID=559628 RepID=A0A2T0RBH1_9ACTN|nr:beta-phosphoglucomutase family hydrolase [Kineococcus rhizosphaerae]PRY18515.1 HAD superfamily hydrolase (TIGR01509 family)/beta-phosphoglucomutase family hydrolase [Kineococcus rhizosphaerae]
MLGLPDHVTALLFDLDGVLTNTAAVHDAAWKATFDVFLRARAERTGEAFRPFDADADYATFVDGKPREDGVRDFLASREIHLPDGSPDDPADQPYEETTVAGLGNRKNADLLRRIASDGVEVYEGSRRYLRAAREAGLRRAVVSSSANTRQVLEVTHLADLVEERVDGVTLREKGIEGKPAPDSFLEGARVLGVDPARAVVFEDALSGVAAGRAGGFGAVVGVDRLGHGHGDALREHGATVVVTDLADLLEQGR